MVSMHIAKPLLSESVLWENSLNRYLRSRIRSHSIRIGIRIGRSTDVMDVVKISWVIDAIHIVWDKFSIWVLLAFLVESKMLKEVENSDL